MLLFNFSGCLLEAGADEAGRGCLAGPVTAAVVIPAAAGHRELGPAALVDPQAGALAVAPGVALAATVVGELRDQAWIAAARVPCAGGVAVADAGAGHRIVAAAVAAPLPGADLEHATAATVDPKLAVAHAEADVFGAAGV